MHTFNLVAPNGDILDTIAQETKEMARSIFWSNWVTLSEEGHKHPCRFCEATIAQSEE